MDIEVDMNLEETTRLDLMDAAPAEVRIGDQPFDPGQPLEKQERFECIHRVEESTEIVGDGAGFVEVTELPLSWVVEPSPLHLLRSWKVPKHALEIGIVEQAVDHCVREGISEGVGVAQRYRIRVESNARHRSNHRIAWT